MTILFFPQYSALREQLIYSIEVKIRSLGMGIGVTAILLASEVLPLGVGTDVTIILKKTVV